MTTAAKPTYNPARGGSGRTENDLGALSKQYSSRDLPAHTKLKYRQDGQGSMSELKSKDFKRDLEEKEKSLKDKNKRLREITSSASSTSSASKKPRTDVAALDADDPVINDDDEEEEDDEDDDDDDDLERELQKIKNEREIEKKIKEEEKKVADEKVRVEIIAKGNPLLNQGPSDFKVKRRWDDDVVFKNCARDDESKKQKHFINDTLRSEFHKKFMDKYIK